MGGENGALSNESPVQQVMRLSDGLWLFLLWGGEEEILLTVTSGYSRNMGSQFVYEVGEGAVR